MNSDFSGDNLTRRSRSGFIIMINGAPLFMFFKEQYLMEKSSFDSEFVAMGQYCEY